MSIDELLQKPYWVIDLLPKQVPADHPGQFFSVEKYWLDKERLAAVREKHIQVILKINCYRDLSIDEEETVNPPPERIAAEMRKRALFLRTGDALILSEPDELYMTVFNPDEELLELITAAAAAEGLFVWQPPA